MTSFYTLDHHLDHRPWPANAPHDGPTEDLTMVHRMPEPPEDAREALLKAMDASRRAPTPPGRPMPPMALDALVALNARF